MGKRRGTGARRRAAAWIAALLHAAGGCDLTLTQERPPYDELEDYEREAVNSIMMRLHAFEDELERHSASIIGRAYDLGPVAEDQNRIDVSFHDMWVAVNLGDDVIHVSVWENLSQGQRDEWASWFGETESAARSRYATFFYGWMATHLAAIQAVFEIQTVEYVYGHRSIFNVERDGERLAVSFARSYAPGLLSAARDTCARIRSRFQDRWGGDFNQDYYGDHFRELTDPRMPAGYYYFLCRHMEEAAIHGVAEIGRPYNFPEELSIIPRD